MTRPVVLVVGAGPAGLTLAAALAQQGVRVRLVDRAPGPSATSRANILHARGVEVLRRVRALGDLPEHALAPLGMTMYAGRRRLTSMRFAPLRGESTQALFVSQASIERRLRDRLDELGVEIGWGTSVTGLHQHEEHVQVTLQRAAAADAADPGSSPEVEGLRVGWVVGCDGAQSTVRSLSGIPFPGSTVVEQFLLADARIRWDRPRTHSAGWFHPDGLLLAMPMPGTDGRRESGTLWRLMADVPTLAPGERLSQEDVLDRFRELVPVRSQDGDAQIEGARWTSVFRIHRRLVPDYRRGRVLLAGDAAHIHSPMGGQGMNTGMGDAENLAWKLALVVDGTAGPELLDSYTAERRPLATTVLASTTTNTRMMVGDRLGWRLLRTLLVVPLLNLPAVQAVATRGASQLWVSYRRGPLGGRGGRRLRPGDRVADRAGRRPDGTATRLHDELGGRWVLLTPPGGGGRAESVARAALGHHLVVLQHTDGDPRSMLVRPDSHLAWRGGRRDPDPGRWLDHALGRGADRSDGDPGEAGDRPLQEVG